MSLIIEALKRARDDAIRRQAAARGLPLAPVPRMRERRRWLSFAVVPLAAALVICLLLLIDLYSRLPDPEQIASASAETASAPISPPAIVPEASEPLVTSPQASPPLASNPPEPIAPDPAPEAQERPDPAPSRQTTTPTDAVDLERPTARPANAGSVASEPVLTSPPSESRENAGAPPSAREFVGQATLRDGQLIDLEGIAWSESEPFALLNGQVIGVGEFIRAYRVSAIQRDHVILEQDGDRVLLRLE